MNASSVNNVSVSMTPLAVSVLLHLGLVAAVIWGMEFNQSTEPKRITPRYVEAKLVEIKPTTKVTQPKQKVIDLTKKRREVEAKKRADAQRKKAAEAKRAEQKKAEQKRIAEEKKKSEQAKKVAAEKARAEKARQIAEAEAREAQLQRELADAVAVEEAQLQAEQDEATVQSFVAAMASRIEQNWSRPPSARKGMQCLLQLNLIPTGEVVNVTVVKSSGNAAFDRSAQQAVMKIGKFDSLQQVPNDLFEKYFRQLSILFNPQDLRL